MDSSSSVHADGDTNENDNEKESSSCWPLWKYVEKQSKIGKGGRNTKFKCMYCKNVYPGSYSRLRNHLLKNSGMGIAICHKATVANVLEMSKMEEQASSKRDAVKIKDIPLPRSVCDSVGSFSVTMTEVEPSSFKLEGYDPLKKRKIVDGPLGKAFNAQAREILDGEIARMFYSAGLPFNLAKNPHFIKSYSLAANSNVAGYNPPGYNALRTKLLKNERAHLQTLLEATKSTWKSKGVTIVCDGWTDPQRRPLINFMAINEGGPMFIRSVNCQGEYKDNFFIATLIKDVITEVGVPNVVQVITDDAPVCKAAGMLVEQAYPSVFWTPCVVHTLNLALKNICAAKNTESNEITYAECRWISEIAASAVMIRNFIMNHSMRLAMFTEFSKLKLLVVAETRFASMIIMLRRFRDVKCQLQSMVISEQWSMYREDNIEKARIVKEKLLDDGWWDSVDYILRFTEPIYSMLRICDTDKPCLHLVYGMWDTMIVKVKRVIFEHEMKSDLEESSFWNVVCNVLEDRWSKSNTQLHCLAYSLNPRCITEDWIKEHSYLQTPNHDANIVKITKNCIKRLFPDAETRTAVTLEFANFFGCFEEFGDEDSIRDRLKLDPLK
ncbi:uncharacterized protein LOC131009614 [Salvia miltiorrhiza]|uniref:uncharacterized protein LOC131009614 n=1 Tax=Salvia miltiorrhiza TaxID=226208 RepID=UPI0025ACC176|nr:uncharacterized protein LOC131009614 [Salvia miltiorrhiza]